MPSTGLGSDRDRTRVRCYEVRPRSSGDSDAIGAASARAADAPEDEQHEQRRSRAAPAASPANRRPSRTGRPARPRASRSCAVPARAPPPRAAGGRDSSACSYALPACDVSPPPAVVSTSRSRFSTNWPISFDDTSASTPRPNCATLPVIDRSVTTSTLVPAPSGVHRDDDRRLGVALPARVAARRVDHDAARSPRRPRRAWRCPCTAR